MRNNVVFRRTTENVRKNRDIKLETTEARRHYLLSEPNCYTTKLFCETLLEKEIKRTQIFMNKPVYLVYQY